MRNFAIYIVVGILLIAILVVLGIMSLFSIDTWIGRFLGLGVVFATFLLLAWFGIRFAINRIEDKLSAQNVYVVEHNKWGIPRKEPIRLVVDPYAVNELKSLKKLYESKVLDKKAYEDEKIALVRKYGTKPPASMMGGFGG